MGAPRQAQSHCMRQEGEKTLSLFTYTRFSGGRGLQDRVFSIMASFLDSTYRLCHESSPVQECTLSCTSYRTCKLPRNLEQALIRHSTLNLNLNLLINLKVENANGVLFSVKCGKILHAPPPAIQFRQPALTPADLLNRQHVLKNL